MKKQIPEMPEILKKLMKETAPPYVKMSGDVIAITYESGFKKCYELMTSEILGGQCEQKKSSEK